MKTPHSKKRPRRRASKAGLPDIPAIDLPPAIFIGEKAKKAIEQLEEQYLQKGDSAIEQLTEAAIAALSTLHTIATLHADESAALGFLQALKRGIRMFDYRMPVKNEKYGYAAPVFRELAKRTANWPGLLSVDRDVQHANQQIIKILQLGKCAELNYQKKQWTRNTPEVRVALNLLKMRALGLSLNKRTDPADPESYWFDDSDFQSLAPLSRVNYKGWFNAFEKLFLQYYGTDFENHKDFSHYWKNAVYKHESKARALIRRDIKKNIKQAFRSLAPKPYPVC